VIQAQKLIGLLEKQEKGGRKGLETVQPKRVLYLEGSGLN